MRFSDLHEYNQVDNTVIDLLTVLSGEGVESIGLDALVSELDAMGMNVDSASLFDELQNLKMIHNIKDGVVYFHSTSQGASTLNKVDPEKDDKVVKKMAQKKVSKELKK
jgi:hypothetical protein